MGTVSNIDDARQARGAEEPPRDSAFAAQLKASLDIQPLVVAVFWNDQKLGRVPALTPFSAMPLSEVSKLRDRAAIAMNLGDASTRPAMIEVAANAIRRRHAWLLESQIQSIARVAVTTALTYAAGNPPVATTEEDPMSDENPNADAAPTGDAPEPKPSDQGDGGGNAEPKDGGETKTGDQ